MSDRTKSVAGPLESLLDEGLRFSRVQEQLYARALAEISLHGDDSDDAEDAVSDLASEYLPRIGEIADTFHGHMLSLLTILRTGASHNAEFQFLAFRIDFNEFYASFSA